MRRGEIWTSAGGQNYAGKPRPVVIVQDDRFDTTASVTVCPFTTDPTDALLFRLPIVPDSVNGLRMDCRVMVDKITTVSKGRIGTRVGRLADQDLVRVNRAMVVFLGIGGPTPCECVTA
jgi:mRNA interferase MazF